MSQLSDEGDARVRRSDRRPVPVENESVLIARCFSLNDSRRALAAAFTRCNIELNELIQADILEPDKIEVVCDKAAEAYAKYVSTHNAYIELQTSLEPDYDFSIPIERLEEIKQTWMLAQRTTSTILDNFALNLQGLHPRDDDRQSTVSSSIESITHLRSKIIGQKERTDSVMKQQSHRLKQQRELLRLKYEAEMKRVELEAEQAVDSEKTALAAAEAEEQELVRGLAKQGLLPIEILADYGLNEEGIPIKPEPADYKPKVVASSLPIKAEHEQKFVPPRKILPTTKLGLNPSATEFVPSTCAHCVHSQPQGFSATDNASLLTTLIESTQLPKVTLGSFDGDPLQYWVFMCRFNAYVDEKCVSDSAKLARLFEYCTGKAYDIIEPCSYMNPSDGLSRAKALLKERFGNDYVIAQAVIKKVVDGPAIKPSNPKSIQDFSDNMKFCVETLKAMGKLAVLDTPERIQTLLLRLPFHLQNKWRRMAVDTLDSTGEYPGISRFSDMISRAAREANDALFGIRAENSAAKSARQPKSFTFAAQDKPDKAKKATAQASKPEITCSWCEKSNHTLDYCRNLKGMSVADRWELAKKRKLCFGCLKSSGHQIKACKAARCGIDGCRIPHSPYLHDSKIHKSSFSKGEGKVNSDPKVQKPTDGASLATMSRQTTSVSLPVVNICVRGRGQEKYIKTRALLDPGSNRTFCSTELLLELELEGSKSSLNLVTINGVHESVVQEVSLEVSSCVGKQKVVQLPTVHAISEFPRILTVDPTDVSKWEHLRDLSPYVLGQGDVHLLIGQDVPQALKPLEIRSGSDHEPYAMRTVLGWTVNGPISEQDDEYVASSFVDSVNPDARLESQVEKFWKLDVGVELAGTRPQMSLDDANVLKLWEEEAQLSSGHYILPIPFKSDPPELPDNYKVAEKRLSYLGKRLAKDAGLHAAYQSEIDKLVSEGYAEPVPASEVRDLNGYEWYIPHHCVSNPNKGKIRVVFDCSAECGGTSLNKQVLQGPDLTNSLIGILVRFREKSIAVMADVQAMYYQVRVSPRHRNALRFLWWKDGDPSKEILIYRMNVHIFGGIWSPSCAAYAMRKTALDNASNFDDATVDTVLRSAYVDDYLKSVDSVEEAVALSNSLQQMLKLGGFKLTKFVSNSRQVLESVSEPDRAKCVKDLDLLQSELPVERALGVHWNIQEDCFCVHITEKSKPHTRRGLLSIASSVYDPLGFVSPCILNAKKLFQDECKLEKGWDEPLEPENLTKWLTWLEELTLLREVKIARCYLPSGFVTVHTQMHHFADASQYAYGTVSFMRFTDSANQVHCAFVMGKSRLAPINPMSIPRLELSAAVQAVRVNSMVTRELDLQVDEVFYWTDSMIVLQYVKNRTKRFHTFVANRIAVIHDGSSPEQWHYVDSASNPADEASRGLKAADMVKQQRWFHGPEFLYKDPSDWPTLPESNDLLKSDCEVKREAKSCNVKAEYSDPDCLLTEEFISRFSDWHKLLRSVSWLFRFLKWLRDRKQSDSTQPLTVDELRASESRLVRYVQSRHFATELKRLVSSQPVPKSSNIKDLSPFVDENGILRVGGRLCHSPLSSESKHPAILPKDHHISTLIVRRVHEHTSCHSGKEHVLALLRENYWIPKARVLVRKVLRQCVKCERLKGRLGEQRMADLPVDRVTPDKPPFTYVGTDCFGPFLVKRGRTREKRYGCVFTCLAIRAIHIEVLHSLQADSFINALVRLSARRGRPSKLRSDNGTNFVRGEKELRASIEEWNRDPKLKDHLLQEHIEWEFNPPTASHMGGVWERQIRTIRKCINFILKDQVLTDESFNTLMCQVEAVVNSRPLTVVSDDASDPEPLTPNHLLLLRSGPQLPPGHFVKEDAYNRRWRHVQFLANMFWKRWLREYLPSLQSKSKWYYSSENWRVGDIVLIMDETTPRRVWPLGRIEQVFLGRDKLVRTVKVRTASTVLVRPIAKLCRLESVTCVE